MIRGRPVQAQGTPLPTKFFFEVNRATAEGKNLFLITPIVPDERIYLDSTAKSPGITIYIFTSQLDLEHATAGLEAVYNIEILRYNLAHSTEHRAAMVSKLPNNAKKGRIMFCVVEEAVSFNQLFEIFSDAFSGSFTIQRIIRVNYGMY